MQCIGALNGAFLVFTHLHDYASKTRPAEHWKLAFSLQPPESWITHVQSLLSTNWPCLHLTSSHSYRVSFSGLTAPASGSLSLSAYLVTQAQAFFDHRDGGHYSFLSVWQNHTRLMHLLANVSKYSF